MPSRREDLLAKTVYMVVGCPGSGKSWVCEQLTEEFHYVHHDLFIGMTGATYLNAIAVAAATSVSPILTEAPFSISQTKDPLEGMGFKVVPVVISEDPEVIRCRYLKRENRNIPVGHLTRQLTYADRAKVWGWFTGTTQEVLAHLRECARLIRGAQENGT